MSDIYSKRMKILSKSGTVGETLNVHTNLIENMTFTNNINYKIATLCDWDGNILEEVEIKFEKHRTFVAEEREVEYFVRFRPEYHPELKFKELHYKKDGRIRLGFYIDIPDYDEEVCGKWIIAGKDDKTTLDRYNVFKCNWCFEWIGLDMKYHNILGALRDSNNSSAKDVNNTLMEGSIISGSTSFLIPSNEMSQQIDIGTKFMIGDRSIPPQVYEVIKVTDTAPLGTVKVYLKQCMFNPHTDIQGDVNSMDGYDFYFDLPLDDLPDDFGRNNHSIANGIRMKNIKDLVVKNPTNNVSWKLRSDGNYIYYGSAKSIIFAESDSPTTLTPIWHIKIGQKEYSYDDLKDYFIFEEVGSNLHISCINKNIVGYVIRVSVYDSSKRYYDFVDMEVRL